VVYIGAVPTSDQDFNNDNDLTMESRVLEDRN
jgi:hypothetical protein